MLTREMMGVALLGLAWFTALMIALDALIDARAMLRRLNAWKASLLEGTHREVPSPLLNRKLTPSSAYIRYVRRDNKTLVTRLFPLLPLTMDLIRRPGFPMAWPVLRALLLQNLDPSDPDFLQQLVDASRLIAGRIG